MSVCRTLTLFLEILGSLRQGGSFQSASQHVKGHKIVEEIVYHPLASVCKLKRSKLLSSTSIITGKQVHLRTCLLLLQ